MDLNLFLIYPLYAGEESCSQVLLWVGQMQYEHGAQRNFPGPFLLGGPFLTLNKELTILGRKKESANDSTLFLRTKTGQVTLQNGEFTWQFVP